MGRLSGIHASSTKRHHRDLTHKPIADVLEAFGFSVVDTSAIGPQVPGFPDMVAGLLGVTYLIQAKTGDDASFTKGELSFDQKWRGAKVVVLPSVESAIIWATSIRSRRAA
jgi:Holliday junction resolvase